LSAKDQHSQSKEISTLGSCHLCPKHAKELESGHRKKEREKERFQYLSSARRSIKEKSLWPLLSSQIAKHAMIFSHAFCQMVFPPRYDQEDMEKTLKV
jgi:hypothetical protein